MTDWVMLLLCFELIPSFFLSLVRFFFLFLVPGFFLSWSVAGNMTNKKFKGSNYIYKWGWRKEKLASRDTLYTPITRKSPKEEYKSLQARVQKETSRVQQSFKKQGDLEQQARFCLLNLLIQGISTRTWRTRLHPSRSLQNHSTLHKFINLPAHLIRVRVRLIGIGIGSLLDTCFIVRLLGDDHGSNSFHPSLRRVSLNLILILTSRGRERLAGLGFGSWLSPDGLTKRNVAFPSLPFW